MENIKSQILSGNIEEAIKAFLAAAQDSPIEKDLLVLSSRYRTNQRNRRMGIIDAKEHSLVDNQITYELLNLLEAISSQPSSPATTHRPPTHTRILFCESNPLQDRNLYSNVEIREIEEIIENVNGRLELIAKFGLTVDLFIKMVKRYTPQVIHVTAFSNDEGIIFHGKSDEPQPIENQSFITYFDLIDFQGSCIFFNTFIEEEFAMALSSKELFIIGYNEIVSIFGAIEFATGFYTALGFGKDNLTATKIGYQTISQGQYASEASKLLVYHHGKKQTFNN